MKKRPEKVQNVAETAKMLIEKGAYVVSSHAYKRKGERALSVADIQNVVTTGFHEKKKDEYKEEFKDWNYALKGKTLNNELARVCIAFDKETSLIIVTVIRLEG